MSFSAEIIDDPTWSFANKTATVSAGVSVKFNNDVIDVRPISISISIYAENWMQKGYDAMIAKAQDEYVLYKTYYQKIVLDSGFASPDLIIADLKSKINKALTEV